jgi:hypothetical protein
VTLSCDPFVSPIFSLIIPELFKILNWKGCLDNLTSDLSVNVDIHFLLMLDTASGSYALETSEFQCSNLHRTLYSGLYGRHLL